MSAMASQITSVSIVYRIDCSDQRKHRVTGFCGGIHRRPMNSPHKWPVTRKMFPFDDVIMMNSWLSCSYVLYHRLGPFSVLDRISAKPLAVDFYAEGGELSWRWLCRHRWHRGCRFHNLRCRRWRQGRRRGGSLVSVSVFIVYYMYIYLISRWLALITNKSYCFLFLVSTLNKDLLSYLILSYVSRITPVRDAIWRHVSLL